MNAEDLGAAFGRSQKHPDHQRTERKMSMWPFSAVFGALVILFFTFCAKNLLEKQDIAA